MAKKKPKQYIIEDQLILEQIYTKVADVMPRKVTALKNCIERYIHFREKSLYDYAPVDRIFFKDSDANDFFRSIGIEKKEITALLPDLYYWKDQELEACKNEFSLTCLMCLRWLMKEKPKDTAMIELVGVYIAFSGKFYSSCHYKCYPYYTPDRKIMDYVVNYMLSNKFDLMKTGSVFGSVKNLTVTWENSYMEEFISDITDERIVYLIHQLYNRIYSFLRNIKDLYYEAAEKKLYLNAENDNFDKEDYRISNNNMTAIANIVETSMNYFTSTQVNVQFCTAVSGSGVDPLDVKSIFENILNDNEKISQLRFVINVMLVDFCNKYPDEKDLTGPKFISHSIGMKPNTKDKDIIRQKNIILEWLSTSERYNRIRTPSTKNNYFKAIMGYIALTINTANKDK